MQTMSTYKIKSKPTINNTVYNAYNTNYSIEAAKGVGAKYARPETPTIENKIVNKNDIKSTNQLTSNNWSTINTNYPFNTAVFFNYEVPYLGLSYTKKIQHLPEIYYTIPFDLENQTKFYQSKLIFKNNSSKKYRMHEGTDAALDFWTDIALEQSASNDFLVQNLQLQEKNDSNVIAQNEQIEYYYYRSMNGTCPICKIEGGDFSLQGGVSFPSGDGPIAGEQGFPLQNSSCRGLEAEIVELLDTYAGSSISLGYPIDWSYTYKDGTTVGGTIESCDDLPSDLLEVYDNFGAAGPDECAAQAEKYPNIDIQFELYDTELVTSSNKPTSPIGTPCSDLFGRIQ
jgi:hypothetical protein